MVVSKSFRQSLSIVKSNPSTLISLSSIFFISSILGAAIGSLIPFFSLAYNIVITSLLISGYLFLSENTYNGSQTSLSDFPSLVKDTYVSVLGAKAIETGIQMAVSTVSLTILFFFWIMGTIYSGGSHSGLDPAESPESIAGLLLFIVVVAFFIGVYSLLAFFLQFHLPAASLGGKSPSEAIKQSYVLSRDNMWSVFKFILVKLGFQTVFISLIVGLYMVFNTLPTNDIGILSSGVSLGLLVIISIPVFVVYRAVLLSFLGRYYVNLCKYNNLYLEEGSYTTEKEKST